MKIGVVNETFPGETRVALIPASLAALGKAGMQLLVETGAGSRAGFADSAYAEKGAQVLASRAEVFAAADLVAQVRSLGANLTAGITDLGLMRSGQAIVGFCDPLSEPAAAQQVAATGAMLLSMELVPRITRAQSMDALSSMATVAGYKAVLLGAEALPKMFPMLMTAAGTLSPAKVFVMGTGVAGLQAIAMARRLGAVVSATDVRAAAKEQVQSLGAKFVESSVDTTKTEGSGGYAKALDEDAARRQREALAQAVAESDVVVTTAAVPGRKAPILLTTAMVEAMAPGSVVVDLAAERGGNCELTRAGQTISHHGVTILGPMNLPATVPSHASQLYAKNVATLLLHLVKNGQLTIDTADEITREILVTRDGQMVHPRVKEILETKA
ncbi:MAG TPA: Re/Si-specific NAD(P)(+) transhydrogenase subunit alpha [Pirellulales bacterium]|jgi:NAD(P) transhydrogenase subunit alpha|nr:Re/Si-specific NAD(P)(+) transhydrogenase subunit alpha [Pirellulales bacterium]